jgi:3D (Asp-Asp-Asp) domain-containing protein
MSTFGLIRRFFLSAAAAALFLTFVPAAQARAGKKPRRFVATAYTQYGITKSGAVSRPGIVAADPNVLPLGSVIRVLDPTGYSGEYEVLDTGSKVKGRHIDIFMWDKDAAKEFGRHPVTVEVVYLARGTSQPDRPGPRPPMS